MSKSTKLARVWRLVRRVDELELLLARIHRVCAVELGLRTRQQARSRKRPYSIRRKLEKEAPAA